ncbi:MAG TPA: hypothetical protein VNZ86_02290, partial [Bacteroidia bacterium]|nr:hypothetical protein [Bacteroidia bacterium]
VKIWGDGSTAAYLQKNYLRKPDFGQYPVLGLTAKQRKIYAAWKTDRLNEMNLIQEGILEFVENDTSKSYFRTDYYLTGNGYHSEQYLDSVRKNVGLRSTLLPDEESKKYNRVVRMEDGILLPYYALPTKTEWNFAIRSSTEVRKKALQDAIRMKKKKYDPGKHFTYLFPVASTPAKAPMYELLKTKNLVPVQEEVEGDNLLCHMSQPRVAFLRGFRLVLPDYHGL